MKFRDLYYFLSNMYPVADMVADLSGNKYTFSNAEAMFQAQKNLAYAKQFEGLDGFKARNLGRKVAIKDRNAWNNLGRLEAMANALNTKFSNPELMSKLSNIQGEIVEDNTWGDTFWGKSNGVGENVLGQMLMNIRDNNNDKEALNSFVKEYSNKGLSKHKPLTGFAKVVREGALPSEFTKSYTVTGHRPGLDHVGKPGFDYADALPSAGFETAPGFAAQKDVYKNIFSELAKEANGSPIRITTGGALGTDLVAALAAEEAKQAYPNIYTFLAAPVADQTKVWTKNPRAVELYNTIKEHSDQFINVEDLPDYQKDIAGLFDEKKIIYQRMLNRNQYMLDNGKDGVIGFMNPAKLTGRMNGTEGTFRLAKAQGIPVYNVFGQVINSPIYKEAMDKLKNPIRAYSKKLFKK